MVGLNSSRAENASVRERYQRNAVSRETALRDPVDCANPFHVKHIWPEADGLGGVRKLEPAHTGSALCIQLAEAAPRARIASSKRILYTESVKTTAS